MPARIFSLFAACGCVSLAAVAAPAFLDGAYGDTAGCHYAKTGESSGADVFFLLNDEGITTATAYCAFTSAAVKTPTGFSISAQCDAEGDIGPDTPLDLLKTGNDYTARFGDGTRWGPLARCR